MGLNKTKSDCMKDQESVVQVKLQKIKYHNTRSNKLDDGWPESEEEHNDTCMYDFHQKSECDRDKACGNVREGESEGKNKREECTVYNILVCCFCFKRLLPRFGFC